MLTILQNHTPKQRSGSSFSPEVTFMSNFKTIVNSQKFKVGRF